MKIKFMSGFFLKIFLSNLIIIALLTLITNYLYYNNATKQFHEKLTESYAFSLRNIAFNIEILSSNLETLTNILMLSTRNENIDQYLFSSIPYTNFAEYKNYMTLLQKMLVISNDVHHLYFYTVDGNVYDLGMGLTDSLGRTYESLLIEGKTAYHTFDDGSLYWIYGIRKQKTAAYKLMKDLNTQQTIGILEIIPRQTALDQIVQKFNFKDHNVFWVDNRENIILQNNWDYSLNEYKEILSVNLEHNEGFFYQKIGTKKYYILYNKIDQLDWTIYFSISLDEVNQLMSEMTIKVLYISFFITIFCIIISIFISYSLSEPIKKLQGIMRQVAEGNLDVQVPLIGKDEIGQLSHCFNVMIIELKKSINDLYVQKLINKESELEALQAQINPHFLYNTLESINCIAEIKGVQEISKMTKMLAKLLRSSISNNSQYITLKKEIDNIHSYVYLQNIRFSGKIYFSFNCNAALELVKIPKLILQPIVENSIIHGLEQKIGNGHLDITITNSGDELFINVKDDGNGFDMEKTIFRSSGLGIKNVDRRIKILFGEKYGITINSEYGIGTTVIINLPIFEEN